MFHDKYAKYILFTFLTFDPVRENVLNWTSFPWKTCHETLKFDITQIQYCFEDIAVSHDLILISKGNWKIHGNWKFQGKTTENNFCLWYGCISNPIIVCLLSEILLKRSILESELVDITFYFRVCFSRPAVSCLRGKTTSSARSRCEIVRFCLKICIIAGLML